MVNKKQKFPSAHSYSTVTSGLGTGDQRKREEGPEMLVGDQSGFGNDVAQAARCPGTGRAAHAYGSPPSQPCRWPQRTATRIPNVCRKVLRRRRRTSAAMVEERGIRMRAWRVEHIVSHTHGKAEDSLAVNGNETHRCPTLSSKRSHRRTQRHA